MTHGWYCHICYSSDPEDYDIIILCDSCLSKRPDNPKVAGPVIKCPEYCNCCRNIIGG